MSPLMSLVVRAASVSPSPSPTVPTAVDDSRVSAGVLGLVFLVLLAVAVVVIFRSMNKQLKKVDFDEEATARPSSPTAQDGPAT